jgi:hypothetical protein
LVERLHAMGAWLKHATARPCTCMFSIGRPTANFSLTA